MKANLSNGGNIKASGKKGATAKIELQGGG